MSEFMFLCMQNLQIILQSGLQDKAESVVKTILAIGNLFHDNPTAKAIALTSNVLGIV